MFSTFKRVAIGVVLTPNKVARKSIDIIVTESVATMSANYEDGVGTVTPSGNGIQGTTVNYSKDLLNTTAKKGTTVTATWLNGGTNRTTAPNVNAGETVELYRAGNSDQYYWRGLFYEPDLRGQELAVFTFSNVDRSGDNKEMINANNSYYLLIDTIHKSIQLHTATNDGEPLAWDITIDTKKGKLTISNDNDDKFIMSEDKIKLESKKIEFKCEDFEVKAKKTIKMDTKLAKIEGGIFNVYSKLLVNGPGATITSLLTVSGMSTFAASVIMGQNAKVITTCPAGAGTGFVV